MRSFWSQKLLKNKLKSYKSIVQKQTLKCCCFDALNNTVPSTVDNTEMKIQKRYCESNSNIVSSSDDFFFYNLQFCIQ